MRKVTDIWFRSELDLETLGSMLGLRDIDHDYENYWEWITGYIDDYQLEITRTHQVEPIETDTRIFLLNKIAFKPKLINKIVNQLQSIGIDAISLGSWTHITGEEFNKKVAKIVS